MKYLVLILALLTPLLAFAMQPEEMLSDPQLEARARAISADLRCLVCQNQSIDDSDADLAHDLRMLVRQRLQAGDSDAAVRQFLVDRYGDYILLSPPLKNSTAALWFGPPLMLLVGAGFVVALYRRRKTNLTETTIPPEEQARLAALIDAGKNAP